MPRMRTGALEGRTLMVIQRTEWEGRPLLVTWLDPPFYPPRRLTTQAYGLCFIPNGQLVLVSAGDGYWNLPGGGPEGAETLEEALAREAWEEASARVLTCTYIGCQKVEDPGNPDGLPVYYQARFWARVELHPFEGRFETTERRLVEPDEFLTALSWGHSPIAPILLERALVCERAASG